MIKILLCLLAVLSVQCSNPAEDSVELSPPVAADNSIWDWIGEYYSGDAEYVGVYLELDELGGFSATSFSCTSPSRKMVGTWVAIDGWIEFSPVDWDEGVGFSMPRMEMLRWKEEFLLLPGGNKSLLEREQYRSNEVFSKGDSEDRDRYFDKVFED